MADSKPIEVKPEPIETDLSALSASEEWLAQANERAELLAEQYRPHDIVGEADYKASKKARADARKDIAKIEAERKSMTDAIERAVRDFKDGAKLALAPLTGIDRLYAEKIGAYEEQWRTDRQLELEGEYEAIAPDLVPLVPFATMLARYGQGKGKAWLNRSTNVEAAKYMLADAVEAIAEGERTVDELVDDEDREAIKGRYFETLDLQATLAEARRAKEQRERVRQLEEERRAREAQARLEREEAERRAAEEAARAEAEREAMEAAYAETEAYPYDYEPAEAAEPAPAPPAPVPYEKPAIVPAPPTQAACESQAAAPAPTPDMPRHWVVDVPSATRKQMEALAATLASMGLVGTISAARHIEQ